MNARDYWWRAAIHGYVGGFGVEMMLASAQRDFGAAMCALLLFGSFMALFSLHALTTGAPSGAKEDDRDG